VFISKACAESDKNMDEEEPTFQYIPVDASPASRNKSQCDKLHQSIMLLYEGLESEALIDQFEVSVLPSKGSFRCCQVV
jgi:hypothetical protein